MLIGEQENGKDKQHRRVEENEPQHQWRNGRQEGPDVGHVIQQEREESPREPKVNAKQKHNQTSTNTRTKSNPRLYHHIGVDTGLNLVANHVHALACTTWIGSFNSSGKQTGFKDDEQQKEQHGNAGNEEHAHT